MRRGFTLLEVMIVVAIIGVVLALAGSATQATQRRAHMHDAARQFRARLEHARTLAIAAGPTLGNAFANCPALPPSVVTGANLAVLVDPATNAYLIPTSLAFNAGAINSNCQSFQVAGADQSRGTATISVNGAAAPAVIAFTASGRLDDAVSPGPVIVRFEDSLGGSATRGFGIRVLPSGVICASSDVAVAGGCDEDP